MAQVYANNARSTLAGSILIGATTCAVQGGDAAKFPSPAPGDFFLATMVDGSGNREIVKCTNRTGVTLTIVRGQESTTPFAFASGANIDCRLTAGTIASLSQPLVVKGHIFGLQVSSNAGDPTNDIDIALGEAASSDSSPILMVLPALLTKRLDADWAPGTNLGGRYSGAAITDTTYFPYLCTKADGSGADVYLHPSGSTNAAVLAHLQAEVGGSSYTRLRRIGAIIRTGAAIVPVNQDGDRHRLVTPVGASFNNPGIAAVTRTLLVPIGISVWAETAIGFQNATSAFVRCLVSALDEVDTDPNSHGKAQMVSAASSVFINGAGTATIKTNTLGQIRSRQSASGASDNFGIYTYGWIDTRDRFG